MPEGRQHGGGVETAAKEHQRCDHQQRDKLELLEIPRPDADDESQEREAEAGQQKKRDHRQRMRDGDIDEERGGCEDHQADEQRFDRCRADIADGDFDEIDRGGEDFIDRADEFREVDPEAGVGGGLRHHGEHHQTGDDECAVADAFDLINAAADGGAEHHEIERGRDHRRDEALDQRTKEARHLENENCADGLKVHAVSFTNPTKISSRELCLVCRSASLRPVSCIFARRVVMPVRSARVSYS